VDLALIFGLLWRKRLSGLDKDRSFLKHILDEIDFLERQSKGLEYQGLMEDEVLQRACIRSLEVIGEATKNLSDNLRKRYPEIEWRKIAGLRDKLIHHYFGVDWDIVWDVMMNEMPELRAKLEAIIIDTADPLDSVDSR
jgi:uncharacterized protein with HEPN domain